VRVGQPFSPNRCLSSDLVHPTGGSRPVSAKLCLPMRIVIDALSPGLWWPRRNLNVKLAGWVLDGANPHGPPRGGDRRYIFSALLVQPGRSWRRAARSPWDGVVAFDDALGLSPRYGSASIHQWTSTGTGRRRAAPVLPERCRLTVRHGDLSGSTWTPPASRSDEEAAARGNCAAADPSDAEGRRNGEDRLPLGGRQGSLLALSPQSIEADCR
jgi:hypothetical protein